jgi:hypothetical protein
LALAHYLGALAVGLIFRYHGRHEAPTREKPRQGNILARALRSLVRARRDDGRPLGQILGDAVNDSVRTLLIISEWDTMRCCGPASTGPHRPGCRPGRRRWACPMLGSGWPGGCMPWGLTAGRRLANWRKSCILHPVPPHLRQSTP